MLLLPPLPLGDGFISKAQVMFVQPFGAKVDEESNVWSCSAENGQDLIS